MKGLIQRVTDAKVEVDGETVGEIGAGTLLLLGVERDDNEVKADKLLHKIQNYRIFADDQGRMNLSLKDTAGELLIVSQFTLVADTAKGMRPGFSRGATPTEGERLYNYFVAQAKQTGLKIATGRFGANMQVSLTNDGPVTFWLES
ncbi:MAG: D-tyrosyl-tRNA(Tyr) deacylase [Oceanospirillaceae bacterium]|nr:D-tyrosyl-tRNA(Tyr) deacylase [Oceanospirillaceae bacterium]